MGTEKVICDTDVLIDYFDCRNSRHESTVYLLNERIGLQNVLISAVTKMEILRGARDNNELRKIEKQISVFDLLNINSGVTDIAVNLIYNYNLSHSLAIPDALIAATAFYADCPLFTYNLRDFKFITNLKVYNQ